MHSCPITQFPARPECTQCGEAILAGYVDHLVPGEAILAGYVDHLVPGEAIPAGYVDHLDPALVVGGGAGRGGRAGGMRVQPGLHRLPPPPRGPRRL